MKQRQRCQATRSDGQPCRAWARSGSRFCFFHDPAMQDDRREAAARGGAVRGFEGGLEPVPLDRPEDVCRLLAATINEVRSGAVPPAVANSIGYLAGQWTKSFETAELARKIAGLELIVQRA